MDEDDTATFDRIALEASVLLELPSPNDLLNVETKQEGDSILLKHPRTGAWIDLGWTVE